MNKQSNIKSQMGDASLLMLTTLAVNIGNYGLNVALARWLGPEGFAEANILATIVMLLSFIAMGLQLVVTRFVAEFQATNNEMSLHSVMHFIKNKSLWVSVVLMLLLMLLSFTISAFFKFDSPVSFILIFLGIPFYFMMSISRGYYQGRCQFKSLAWTYLLEMVVRLVITIGLLYLLMPYSISSEIIAIGFLISFVVTQLSFKIKHNAYELVSPSVKKRMFQAFMIISFYELSQILINNSDVMLVKHFFENEEAGLYASIALLGRAVFFATWIIVTMLFPKVIEKEKKGEPHTKLFWGALSIVFCVGLMIIIGSYFLDDFIINIAFGSDYGSVSNLLWLYALSTTLFACANVFVYYFMSLEKYWPVFISMIAGVVQILSIVLFHGDLESVVRVQIVIMSLLLGSMIIYYHLQNSKFSIPEINKFKIQNQSK